MVSPLRQIQDIQVQAERLLSNKANLEQIAEFAKYSSEIKFYLLQNIEDEEILLYVRDIPSFEIEKSAVKKTADGFIATILSIASYGLAGYFRNLRERDEALDVVRSIRSKYASIEFMCKNYFE